MTNAERSAQYRTTKKLLGLCSHCGQREAEDGNTACTECRERRRKAQNKRRVQRKQSSLCACGKQPQTEGSLRCSSCAEYDKTWYKRNADNSKKASKQNHIRYRKMVLKHYGYRCACCGESTYEFLAIDHINNNGAEHRREIGLSNIYSWLVQNKFPPGFQTLCHNCNAAKQYYGVCPHQRQELKVAV